MSDVADARARHRHLFYQGGHERIASHVIKRAGGRLYKTYKDDVTFKNERNRRECLSLAKVIDQARREGVKSKSLFMEMAIRRLVGVQSADTADDDWSICDEIELDSSSQTFIPPKVLQRALANTRRFLALKNHRGSAHHEGNMNGDDSGEDNNGDDSDDGSTGNDDNSFSSEPDEDASDASSPYDEE
jgi:hypothetical protein